MSIGLAAVVARAATTLPTTLPTMAPAVDASDGPPWLIAALAGWAAVGLVAAGGLGAFRRRGIAGPERLRPWDSAWTLLGIIGGGLAAWIVGSMLAVAVVTTGLRVAHAHPSTDVTNLVVGGLGEAVAVAVMLALVRGFWSSSRSGLQLIGLSPRGIPNALAGGTAALFVLFPLVQLTGVAVIQVYRWLHLPQAKAHPVLEMMRADQGLAMAVAAVVTAAVVAPVAEELVFRGLLQTMLARLFSRAADVVASAARAGPVAPPVHTRPAARWAAVVVTSAAFAAVHYSAEPEAVVPIFVLSVGLGFVYERSGNLWMNTVTHGLFNAAQIAVFLTARG